MIFSRLLLPAFLLLYTLPDSCTRLFYPNEERLAEKAMNRTGKISELFREWDHHGNTRIDSITVSRETKTLSLYFNDGLTNLPVRNPFVEHLKSEIIRALGLRFRKYGIELYSGCRDVGDFIPNYFRLNENVDHSRLFKAEEGGPLVKKEGHQYPGGLSGAHIALWPSHGYYFEAVRNRWEWQRARLYGTIEDLFTFSFLRPYIIPMLENAGAYVILPRERDIQSNEVIVAGSGSSGNSEMIITNGRLGSWIKDEGRGFVISDTLFQGDNPFTGGCSFRIKAAGSQGASIRYIPDIPEEGEYAVSVSWARHQGNISGVKYVVNHSGGSQEYFVDQTIGSSTWIYLGTHHFFKGRDPDRGSVLLSGDGSGSGYITADAVRFGGGLGSVARRKADFQGQGKEGTGEGWRLSGRPRYMEAARYYLQYSGMPDSTVYSLSLGKCDYNDDLMSRGEWINFLTGAPMGVTGVPAPDSPRIPVDMALALHTDAGVTPGDSIIGTLAIYSNEDFSSTYYNGISRFASRDLADMVQTQLVNDIRQMVNEKWTHRGLMNRRYSEAARPQVPVVLLELLSHQNLADMRYGLDPRFRFLASRAIYKGILRYLSFTRGTPYIIQPLPPAGMAIEKTGPLTARISWRATEDPMEPSAAAAAFRVYKRRENAGFDSGTRVKENYIDVELPEAHTLFSFKVTAVNEGGESLPGEILSVSLTGKNDKPVLVVNCFTRISAPSFIDNGMFAGIKWWDDPGVPDKQDFSHTGVQYDFNRQNPWLDDDSPGWGASRADMEGKIIPGNTFDFPAHYGEALRDNGYSFISKSREAFENQLHIEAGDYAALIIIFGEQRGIQAWHDPGASEFDVFSPGMICALKSWIQKGSGIMISGSHLGTDMIERNDSAAIEFAREYLGFTWRTNHACNTGRLTATDHCPALFPGKLEFNACYHPEIYSVLAPDALEPAGDDATVIYRYGSNLTNAGILKAGSSRTISFGFPLESIICDGHFREMIKGIMVELTGH